MLRHYKFSTPITRSLRINAKNEQNFTPAHKLYAIKPHENKCKRSNMVFLFLQCLKELVNNVPPAANTRGTLRLSRLKGERFPNIINIKRLFCMLKRRSLLINIEF